MKLDQYVNEMLEALEETVLKERLTSLMDALSRAERSGKQEDALRTLADIKEVSRQINVLRTKQPETGTQKG